MKSKYISTLQVGDSISNEPFLLQDTILRNTKDNRPYLLFNLRDKTGQLGGVFWDIPDYVKSWARTGSIVLITGRVNSYKDSIQILATDMNQATNPDMADFLPSSARSTAEMLTELKQLIGELADPWQGLLTHLLLNEEYLPKFQSAPAARIMHHGYIGGLIEHSLSMANLGKMLSQHYDYVNKDLLIAGALLHDMGKTEEYSVQESFSHSEDGRLVGHIVRAIVMIEKGAAEINFPETELRELIHLVASHHGTQEWGSPVVPQTLEAVLLHQVDLLDSRVQGFLDHVRDDQSEDSWTDKQSRMFGVHLKRPSSFPTGK